MCGRFSLIATREEVEAFIAAIIDAEFPPRYNIAPTQPIMMVVAGEARPEGSNLPDRKSILVRWGFIPSWVKDPNSWPLMINMRSETAVQKNSFRIAMNHFRALVPASGFYEWRKVDKNKRQAYWIRPREGGIVAFGALMETWSGTDGSQVDTGGLLTTRANKTLAPIHDRMPVVIKPEDFNRWLNCKHYLPHEVEDLMQPVEDDFFEAIPVSDKVNHVANITPDVQERVEEDLAPQKPALKRKKKTDSGDDSGGQLSMF
ncbi:SOS response-associated peptidase [Paenochrobactrum pullorum]|uniref:SOS response-associated peptidase n=1 Tax=Paenochrobactrum pullorum TaxID=1324351 RepID=UPI0035BBF703